MKKVIFTGSGVAIVTPMNQDYSINYDQLGKLIDWHVEQGTDCIVICGTTGESTTMSDDEHVECIRYTVERVAGRIPVVAGAGSNDTAYAVWMSQKAKEVGADALLHSTPYYNKTSQTGLVKHFNAIADATDLPVILYNVPGRTGMTIKPETYLELSKHPNIAATKEASGDISLIAKTAALCGDNLHIYSGNDDQTIPVLAIGGKGVISVLGNIMPKETHMISQLHLDGKADQALALYIKLLPIANVLFDDVNPIPVKEAMNLMGLCAGPCRMPLCEIGPAAKRALETELQKLGLIQ